MTERKRRATPAEREAAVARYVASGLSARQVAAEEGVSPRTMEAWIARVRREQIDPDDTMSEAQRREVLRLQRENAALQREVEFLKKAGAFFRDRDHGPKGMR